MGAFMGDFFEGFLKISVISSVFILLIALISPFLKKKHTVFWRYILWIALGIRLALPFDFSLQQYAVSLPIPKIGDTQSLHSASSSQNNKNIQKEVPDQDENRALGNGTQDENRTLKNENQDDNRTLESGNEDSNRLLKDGNEDNNRALKDGNQNKNWALKDGNRDNNYTLKNGIKGVAGKNTMNGGENVKGEKFDKAVYWLFYIWAAVAALLCIAQGGGYWIFYQKLKKSKTYLWNKGNVPVYCSTAVHSPMLVGIFKPQIILPPQDFTKTQLEFAVSHEFAHYKRKDLIVKLLLAWARTLHWFNPFVYYMEQRAEKDMELLCDSQVIRHFSKEEKKQYGELLLAYASGAGKAGSWLCVSRFSKKTNTLKERFSNLFSSTGKRRGIVIAAAGIGVVLSASLFLAFGWKENVSISERMNKQEKVNLTKPENEIKMPELSLENAAKMRYGAVMPQLVYASPKRAIIYDYWGMMIYDVKNRKIEQMLDLPALDLAHVQGSTVTNVEISEDGSQILLYNGPDTKERFLYDVDKKQLQHTSQEHFEHSYDDVIYDHVVESENGNPFVVLSAADSADIYMQAQAEILDMSANTSAIAYLTCDSLKKKNGKVFHGHDIMGMSLVIKFNGLGEAQIYPLFQEYYESQGKNAMIQCKYKDVEHQPVYEKYLYEDEDGWKYSLEQDKKKESRIQEFASVLDPLLLVRSKDGKRQILEDLIIPEMVSWSPILFVDGRIVYKAAPSADMGGVKDPVLVSIALDGSDRKTADDILYHDFDHLCEDNGWIYYAGWTQDNGFPQPLCRISADFRSGLQFVQNIPGTLIGVENDVAYYLADSTKQSGIYWRNLKTGEEQLYDKWGVSAEQLYLLNSRETQFKKEGKEGLASGSHLIFSYDYNGEVYTQNVEFKVK